MVPALGMSPPRAPPITTFGDNMKINTGQWLEMFRAGNYGQKGNYTTRDLDSIVINFKDRVPIVVGHPVSNAPAQGWLNGLKRTGDVLLGKVGELNQDFVLALAENKFRNMSVRIDRSGNGPKLLHLGFLGAVLPHVEGLNKTVSFAGGVCCADFQFRCGYDLAYKV